jgi:predicted transcriptional regulator YheO
VTLTLSNLVATDTEHREQPLETLRDRTARELRKAVEEHAAERAATPRSLSREDKKALVRQLQRDGYFDSRDAAQTIADLLGVSRATVYNYAKQHSG